MTDLTAVPDPDDNALTPPPDLGPVGSAYFARVSDEFDIGATEEPPSAKCAGPLTPWRR